MTNQPPPVFLERRSYRRRRATDAIRLLPWFGTLVFTVPLIWPVNPPGETGVSDTSVPMSHAMLYIFFAWTGLILLSAFLSWAVRAGEPETEVSGESRAP